MLYLELFLTFFKIGLFTIGGGYAMIPLIQQEMLTKGWILQQDLIDFIGISESTPGPFAINIATFVGMKTSGLLGAVISTFGVVLPSFIIILLIAKFFMNFQDNFYVRGALTGLRPTVVGLVAAAAISVFITNFIPLSIPLPQLFSQMDYLGIVIFVIVAVVYFKKNLHPIKLILLSAGLGIVFYGISEYVVSSGLLGMFTSKGV